MNGGVRATPPVYRLSVRINPDQGGPVAAAVVDQDGLLRSSARYVLLLVHGFNNSRSDAETSYRIFTTHIRPGLERSRVAPDAIAQFHWPGDESMGILPRATGYARDFRRALDSAMRLAKFLEGLTATRTGTSPLRITLLGHSLGCRLILEALSTPSNTPPAIEIIGLMAAATPVDLARKGGALFGTAKPPRQVLKFCSEQDQVLHLAFPLGQIAALATGETSTNLEAIGRFGHPIEFGLRSPRPKNGHSDYWPDQVVADIMLSQIDPTMRQLTPPAEIPDRKLLSGARQEARQLLTRD
jgi:esterase/lipase superfamily enzyme